MGLAIGILVLALVALVIGGSIVIGAPVFAIPVLVVIGIGWTAYEVGRRAKRRDADGDEPVRFTEEDRKTLEPTPTPEERTRNRRAAARAARR
jgi:hypothetical protein